MNGKVFGLVSAVVLGIIGARAFRPYAVLISRINKASSVEELTALYPVINESFTAGQLSMAEFDRLGAAYQDKFHSLYHAPVAKILGVLIWQPGWNGWQSTEKPVSIYKKLYFQIEVSADIAPQSLTVTMNGLSVSAETITGPFDHRLIPTFPIGGTTGLTIPWGNYNAIVTIPTDSISIGIKVE